MSFLPGDAAERQIHEYLVYGMYLMGITTFVATLKIVAPYGRHAPKDSSWGPLIPAQLGWLFMEFPPVAWTLSGLLFLGKSECTTNLPNILLACCFLAHYVHRSLVYPWLLREPRPMPVSIPLMAMFYCTYNGYIQSRWLTAFNVYPSEWIFDWRFLIGVALWAWGFYSNIRCDWILINLRKPGEQGYKIPTGYLFEYVSAANYFAEFVEWIGFAVATWSLVGLSFALYTFANLATRGVAHHKSYLQKFDNYPKNRKAILPFIW